MTKTNQVIFIYYEIDKWYRHSFPGMFYLFMKCFVANHVFPAVHQDEYSLEQFLRCNVIEFTHRQGMDSIDHAPALNQSGRSPKVVALFLLQTLVAM